MKKSISFLSAICIVFVSRLAYLHDQENHPPDRSEFLQLPVTCHYFDPKDLHTLKAKPRYVWALGENGQYLYAEGHLVDGFFHVDSLSEWGLAWNGFNKIKQYKSDLNKIENLCEMTLHAFGLKEDVPLLKIEVQEGKWSLHGIPTVFADQLQNAISRIVLFGDSLSDDGNLNKWVRVFPKGPYFGGRFTNGPIWIEYFRQTTGISVQNWASGGAITESFVDAELTYEELADTFRSEARTLLTGSFASNVQRFRKNSLRGERMESPDNTLFVIWIGGNDYLYKLDREVKVNRFIDRPRDLHGGHEFLIARTTDGIIEQMRELYGLGARKFVVGNLPDLGQIPKILENDAYHLSIDEPRTKKILQLSEKMTIITEKHNEMLEEKIALLKDELQDIEIVIIDVFQGLKNIQNNVSFDGSGFQDYGLDLENFTEVMEFENSKITFMKPCYKGWIFMADFESICDNPHQSLFWDQHHPSTYGHCLISNRFHQVLYNEGYITMPFMSDPHNACTAKLWRHIQFPE